MYVLCMDFSLQVQIVYRCKLQNDIASATAISRENQDLMTISFTTLDQ